MHFAVEFKLSSWFSHTVLCQVWCLLSLMVSLFIGSKRNWFCHSYKFLLFYTLASLGSVIANIYSVLFVLWPSVSWLLFQSLCYDCVVFDAGYSGCFRCGLAYLFSYFLSSLLSHEYFCSRDVHTTTPKCQKQSPLSTHLTCPLWHRLGHILRTLPVHLACVNVW